MKLKHLLFLLGAAILSSCTAGGSASGSGTMTTSEHGHSTTTSGRGMVSGSGFINRN
jgi:hypothetical protein